MNQNLKLNVEKLQSVLSKLKASDAQFASNLIASFKKYGGLTPKQEPWIEKLIARASFETFQVVPVKPFSQLAAEVEVGDFAGALKLFAEAKTHLKYPKIRLQVEGTKVILALNGEKSKKPGHVTVKGEGSYPNYTFYGSVSPEGVFTPANATYGAFKTALIKLLTDLAANPARVAKDYAKLTGNCCFCGKDIGYGKEVRSVLVGFGPDCAEHYGLKGEWLAAAEKAEAKASAAVLKHLIPAEATEVSISPYAQSVIDAYAELPANISTVADVPSFTVFASYEPTAKTWAPGTANEAADGTPLNTLGQPILTGHSDTVLAAEAQHEAAYEAEIKTKDDAFWSSVGTSIAGGYWEEIKNGEVTAKIVPGPVVPVAAEKPEWVKDFQAGAESQGFAASMEKYWDAADQAKNDADKAQAFEQVPVDAYQVEAGWAFQTADAQPESHTCFFCEQVVDAVKILHGYSVCFTCVEQLKG